MSMPDPHSYYDDAQPRGRHLRWRADIDMDRRVIEASLAITLERPHSGALDLDARDVTVHDVKTADGQSVSVGVDLISLCNAHHWVVHEGGFTVVVRSPGRWALLGPTGVVVEPEPPATNGPARHRRHDVAADAVTGHWQGDRMTHYALDVILNAIGAFEPTRLRLSTDVSAETSVRAVA